MNPSRQAMFNGVSAHLRAFWPEREQAPLEWPVGPVSEHLPGFEIIRVAPQRPADPWVFCSNGAWQATAGTGSGLEFFLLSPSDEAAHVELIAMVADLHVDPRYRLSVGSVMEIGRPWVRGSACDHLLVALPLPFGRDLELCHVGPFHLQFTWLVPITMSEASVARTDGPTALEDLLEAAQVDVLDPGRRSVV